MKPNILQENGIIRECFHFKKSESRVSVLNQKENLELRALKPSSRG